MSYQNSEKSISNNQETFFNLKLFSDYFIFKHDILSKENEEKQNCIKESEQKLYQVLKDLKSTNNFIYQYTSLINEFQRNISLRKNSMIINLFL